MLNVESPRNQEQVAAAERLEGQVNDEASIALAIRLQQEDDESALRNGVTDGEVVVQAVPVAAAQGRLRRYVWSTEVGAEVGGLQNAMW
jgi:hypothetical protein